MNKKCFTVWNRNIFKGLRCSVFQWIVKIFHRKKKRHGPWTLRNIGHRTGCCGSGRDFLLWSYNPFNKLIKLHLKIFALTLPILFSDDPWWWGRQPGIDIPAEMQESVGLGLKADFLSWHSWRWNNYTPSVDEVEREVKHTVIVWLHEQVR